MAVYANKGGRRGCLNILSAAKLLCVFLNAETKDHQHDL